MHLDVSKLLTVPLCAEQFALAALSTDRKLRWGSVYAMLASLQSGFIRFLIQENLAESFTTMDMTTRLLNRFIEDYLSRKNDDQTYAINIETRIHYLSALRNIHGGLIRNKEPLPEDSVIRRNPWAGAYRDPAQRNPIKQPDREKLGHLYAVCYQAVKSKMETVEALWALERRERANVDNLVLLGWSKAEALAAQSLLLVKTYFGQVIPQRKDLTENDHPLWPMIQQFGYKDMARAFGPYASDLCPFIFYLLFHTGFNQQPLVDLKVSEIGSLEFEGTRYLVFQSVKRRAHASYSTDGMVVTESFVESKDPMSPYNIVPFLIKWTSGIRLAASAEDADNLFIYQFRNRRVEDPVRSYAHGELSKTLFNTHSGSLCRIAGIKWTGEQEIRRLMSEIAAEVVNGHMDQIAKHLHHATVETTHSRYRTDAMRAHGMDMLARGMNVRTRWALSRGKIEARNVHKDHDVSGATPPFGCIDPYDSPLRSETPGQLCLGYGFCADCPHATLDITNVRAAARCLELRGLYGQARAVMTPEAFEERWGAQLRALEKGWLPAFHSTIWPAASTLTLPPLPALE
ncbi:hypothetical protein KR767_06690 [Luteibacter anthropi]|uniref:hypothetical protein n=1 Tax=Luteibacter anthropi TaxID=564369 RepID=UPI00203228C0|nr:hypothetical protein [Luteibacter anthropi]URX63736.1 hypothetical protein KR767_06690 [Luteibacter anthropi]